MVLVFPLREVNHYGGAMTNEDDTADAARVSNWTLATGTKPGARKVYSPPSGSTAARVGPEAKSS
jgi:hypothetical protein